ncbi:MAG: hypothetical protein CVU07_11845 [Bacteroidetes bacterium HGW-Bacteroidetes-23]|nr:MAG: hypothetical protein CVU07_11845 [Bacteroidetes bacterium HGW-Bacteroidetes-23]
MLASFKFSFGKELFDARFLFEININQFSIKMKEDIINKEHHIGISIYFFILNCMIKKADKKPINGEKTIG